MDFKILLFLSFFAALTTVHGEEPTDMTSGEGQQQEEDGSAVPPVAALVGGATRDLRRAPPKADEPKCGTAELSYQPCTSKTVANKLFLACCEQFVAPECHFLCQYETDHAAAKKLILQAMSSRCGLKPLSGVLYCASQNRDNRQCCQDLDLNSPQLLVGSRCLRMCDPAGTQLGRLEKEDATCLYNWNVVMYCHHSGIREM